MTDLYEIHNDNSTNNDNNKIYRPLAVYATSETISRKRPQLIAGRDENNILSSFSTSAFKKTKTEVLTANLDKNLIDIVKIEDKVSNNELKNHYLLRISNQIMKAVTHHNTKKARDTVLDILEDLVIEMSLDLDAHYSSRQQNSFKPIEEQKEQKKQREIKNETQQSTIVIQKQFTTDDIAKRIVDYFCLSRKRQRWMIPAVKTILMECCKEANTLKDKEQNKDQEEKIEESEELELEQEQDQDQEQEKEIIEDNKLSTIYDDLYENCKEKEKDQNQDQALLAARPGAPVISNTVIDNNNNSLLANPLSSKGTQQKQSFMDKIRSIVWF